MQIELIKTCKVLLTDNKFSEKRDVVVATLACTLKISVLL